MKINVPFLSIFFILLFVCGSILAQQNRWSYVATDVDTTKFFIDRKSLQIKGNERQIWQKALYYDDSYRISLTNWNCTDKKYFVIEVSIYLPDGSFNERQKGTDWILVTPDSTGETLYKTVCNLPEDSKLKTLSDKAAQVISKDSVLRNEPSKSSKIIRKVKIDERLELADASQIKGWYPIIIPRTKKIGWIYGNSIRLIENPIE